MTVKMQVLKWIVTSCANIVHSLSEQLVELVSHLIRFFQYVGAIVQTNWNRHLSKFTFSTWHAVLVFVTALCIIMVHWNIASEKGAYFLYVFTIFLKKFERVWKLNVSTNGSVCPYFHICASLPHHPYQSGTSICNWWTNNDAALSLQIVVHIHICIW